MGSYFSSQTDGESTTYPVNVTNIALHKVAAKQEPKKNQCSTDDYCKIEDMEIKAIEKMKALDDANTKKNNITTENFDKTWDEFMKNNKNVLNMLSIPTFAEEREQISKAFSEGTNRDKQQAIDDYKKVVDQTLTAIARRNAVKEPEPAPTAKKK